jgi:nucleoside-diphosphate-sugar epimerase
LRSEALVDGVYIDNAARAHVLAAEKLARQSAGGPAGPAGGPAGRAYFIAQGEPLTAGELIGRILAAAAAARGEELAIRGFWPAGPGRIAARALETAWKILPLAGEPPLTSFVAEELTLPHWFNLDRARLDLGYEPTISLAEGLRLLAGKGGENKLL